MSMPSLNCAVKRILSKNKYSYMKLHPNVYKDLFTNEQTIINEVFSGSRPFEDLLLLPATSRNAFAIDLMLSVSLGFGNEKFWLFGNMYDGEDCGLNIKVFRALEAIDFKTLMVNETDYIRPHTKTLCENLKSRPEMFEVFNGALYFKNPQFMLIRLGEQSDSFNETEMILLRIYFELYNRELTNRKIEEFSKTIETIICGWD